MAWFNQRLRQRLLGAFVLTALAVIVLPMLLIQQQEPAQVQVDVPDMPSMPILPEIQIEAVSVPEPPAVQNDTDIASEQLASSVDDKPDVEKGPAADDSKPLVAQADTPAPASPANKPAVLPSKPTAQTAPIANQPPVSRLDTASLPISWSVQLVSLKNHDNAEKLRDDLRRKGYNAYIRSADGMSKVLVGPLIDLNAANRLRSELEIKQQLKGFVTRFQP